MGVKWARIFIIDCFKYRTLKKKFSTRNRQNVADIKITPARNGYVLPVVDEASRHLFAFSTPSKEADGGIASYLQKLFLTFGTPLAVRSDAAGKEYTATIGTTRLIAERKSTLCTALRSIPPGNKG